MKLESSRLGTVEVDDDRVLEFPEGFPGFSGTQFAELAGESPEVTCLQSVTDPESSVLIIDPSKIRSDYAPRPRVSEMGALGVRDTWRDQVDCRVIVWQDAEGKLLVNFFAPLFIHPERRVALQIPLVGSPYRTRERWPPEPETRPEAPRATGTEREQGP